MNSKSSVEQIRQRFDNDVERFSNLETGQSAVMDAVLMLDLVAQAASAVTPKATHVLDIGCGAGNLTLRLLERLPNLNCTLVDLSQPMLDRAKERVSAATSGEVKILQRDIRDVVLQPHSFDIVLAGASLHHLREEREWRSVFTNCFDWLRPGGSMWISDMIQQTHPAVEAMMRERYIAYLTELKDATYARHVLDYIEAEDTPRPLEWQLGRLRIAGFEDVEILHKHALFAAFGGIKRVNSA